MMAWIIAYDYSHVNHFQYVTLINAFKSKGCNARLIHHPDLLVIDNRLYYQGNPIEAPDIGVMKVFPSNQLWLSKFQYLQKMGTLLVNDPESLFKYGDKVQMYQRLENCGIPIPKTLCLELSHIDIDMINWPCVIKPNISIASLGLSVCENREQLHQAIKSMDNQRYKQTHIVVQEIVQANYMIYFNAIGDTFYCNISHGRSNWLSKTTQRKIKPVYDKEYLLLPYQPNDTILSLMKNSMKALQYDLARGEIFIDQNGNPIICELNGTSHFGLQSITFRENVANHIAEHIMQKYQSSTTLV